MEQNIQSQEWVGQIAGIAIQATGLRMVTDLMLGGLLFQRTPLDVALEVARNLDRKLSEAIAAIDRAAERHPVGTSEHVLLANQDEEVKEAQSTLRRDIIAKLRKAHEEVGILAGVGRPLFGGRREHVPTVDTTTGKVYRSKAAVGRAFAVAAGTTVDDNFAWFKVDTKFRGRFRDATPAEIAKARRKGEIP